MVLYLSKTYKIFDKYKIIVVLLEDNKVFDKTLATGHQSRDR